MSDASATIGIIGLGNIGGGLARNLLAAGRAVRGCEPRAAALRAFVDAGGEAAEDAAAVAGGLATLIVCVFDAPQAEQVLFGPRGALAALAPGAVIAMHTTVSPAEVAAIAGRVAGAGHVLVDAPVTGGKAGADAGTLTIIESGDDDACARLAPVFETYSGHVVRAGPRAGDATTVKMVNQLLNGVHLVATAEALAFAVKAGADPRLVYDVIMHGTGYSRAFDSRAPVMLDGDYEPPRGTLDIFAKDLGIVAGMAADMGFDAALASAALARFRAAAEAGLTGTDSAAVVKTYERENGIDVAGAARRTRRD